MPQLGRDDDGRRRCHVQRRSMAGRPWRRGRPSTDLIGDQVVSGRPDAGCAGRPGDHRRRTLVAGAGRDRPRPGHGRPSSAPGSVVGAAVCRSRRPAAREPRARRRKGTGPRAARRGQGGPSRCRHGRSPWSVSPRSVSTPDVAAWMSPDGPRGARPPASHPLRRCSIASIHPARLRTFRRGRATSPRPSRPMLSRARRPISRAKADVDSIAQLYVPILLAFSVFALLAAGVHHRQRRQRHRPDELSRYRRHEGRRIHARAR